MTSTTFGSAKSEIQKKLVHPAVLAWVNSVHEKNVQLTIAESHRAIVGISANRAGPLII